ncbi:chemotaxis protein CheY [Vitreoscilla filiformis]|uniref:Chemotaxis protein CheY n=2 Tax=Vitreoscilla filiformis TaxID=63 RepID=A0A221KHS0_VITFI|nr:chemotaxis protein CheY [Vitreoscilla filiformis]
MRMNTPFSATDRVFIVDDDLSMREALTSLLRSTGLRVQAFASAAEFLAHLAQPAPATPDGPACLVLDVRMPGMSGLELQRELSERGARLPIVFITGHGDIPMTVRAMRAGAVEFLPKPFRDQELLEAIGLSLAQARTAQQEENALRGVRARFDTLTPREREVLALMVQGLRNKLTADRLGISEVTVKVHRHNVMEKMQAKSLPELVGMCERLGMRAGA